MYNQKKEIMAIRTLMSALISPHNAFFAMMTSRFYSLQWRTWGACFIQAAWRRYCKRKLDKSLHEAENRLQDALANEAVTFPQKPAELNFDAENR